MRSGLNRKTVSLMVGIILAAHASRSSWSSADEPAAVFQVGAARREITPEKPVPMWGYSARHDRRSEGVLDPLFVTAVVIEAGDAKLAIAGVDLGRAPTPVMMAQIREAVARVDIGTVLIAASHTHHGPVIELNDRPGEGKGKFDDAVAYGKQLPEKIIQAILDAHAAREPARLGFGFKEVNLNRNRQSKRPEAATDPRLTVLRFDRANGSPIALLVHYSAHPTLTDGKDDRFSADYPGHLRNRVEANLNAPCVFIQGAGGDLSAKPPAGLTTANRYGEHLGDLVVEIARGVVAKPPRRGTIRTAVDRHQFASRVNFQSAITRLVYSRTFFPELIGAYLEEIGSGINPEVSTVVLNDEIAIVGLPGEPFSSHAIQWRRRAMVPCALVFGCCNGHFLYFPTIEAAAEGGYGADSRMVPIEIGAGEVMMDRALIRLYELLGKFPATTPSPKH